MDDEERDALERRVEWLERELQARTAVMEQLFAAYVITEKEKDRPGFAAIVSKAFEDRIQRELAERPEAERDAFISAYKRIFSRVKTLPPWKANDLRYAFFWTLQHYWNKLFERRNRPPE